MSDSRRDPEPGDLLKAGKEMIACTERQGNVVRYLLRKVNGAEIAGACSTDEWFRMVCHATPAGKVAVTRKIFEGAR